MSFAKFGMFSVIISSNTLSASFCFTPSGTVDTIVGSLIIVPWVPEALFLLFFPQSILFLLFKLGELH